MSWNSRIIKKYGLHLDNSPQNRNKLLELHKNDTLIILLNVSSIKRAKSDSLWLKTKDISTKLAKQININKIDQYYHKITIVARVDQTLVHAKYGQNLPRSDYQEYSKKKREGFVIFLVAKSVHLGRSASSVKLCPMDRCQYA